MANAKLTKPKVFWEINWDDWRKLHPGNYYEFKRKSAKDKVRILDKVDYLTEYALGRIEEKELQPEKRGREYDLNKMQRYALHDPPKKVKYKVNPIDHPEKFTKEWKNKYEEKFTKKAYAAEINKTLRKTCFKKGHQAHLQGGRQD